MRGQNSKGFTAVEAVLIVVVLGIVGFTAWWAIKSRNAVSTEKVATASASPASTKTAAPTLTAATTKYCDPIEKSCISYDGTWTKSTTSYNDPEIGKDRVNVKLTSTKYSGLTVSFQPYLGGIGGGCSAGSVIKIDSITGAAGVKLVTDYIEYTESGSGPTMYWPRLTVQANKNLALGDTDCAGLGAYTVNQSKNGALNANFSVKSYKTAAEAKAFLNTAEAQAAKKVLESLTL